MNQICTICNILWSVCITLYTDNANNYMLACMHPRRTTNLALWEEDFDAYIPSLTQEQQHPHKCVLWGKLFKHKRSLDPHIKNHIGSNTNEPTCSTCHKTFYDQGRLNEHKKIHSNINFKCSICKTIFSTTGNLTRHTKTVHNST